MWKHKESKWLVRGGRKVKCYLCGKKILAKGDLFLFHGDTGYYSHQSCQAESTTISGNERRRAVKKIAVGAAVVGAIAAGAGKFLDVSSQSKNSPAAQTILTSQGLIPPALTSDPANPVPGQMWYRSDAGVMAHFDAVQNRVVYSSEINDGNANVTSKGIINGLSVLPNDGKGGFGPDTTKGATAPGQYGSPYTETCGIMEGILNSPTIYNGLSQRDVPNVNLKLVGDSFKISAPIYMYDDWFLTIEANNPSDSGLLLGRINSQILSSSDQGAFLVYRTPSTAIASTESGGGNLTIRGSLQINQTVKITNSPVDSVYAFTTYDRVGVTDPYTGSEAGGSALANIVIDTLTVYDSSGENGVAEISENGGATECVINFLNVLGSANTNARSLLSLGWNNFTCNALLIDGLDSTLPSVASGSYNGIALDYYKLGSTNNFGIIHMFGYYNAFINWGPSQGFISQVFFEIQALPASGQYGIDGAYVINPGNALIIGAASFNSVSGGSGGTGGIFSLPIENSWVIRMLSTNTYYTDPTSNGSTSFNQPEFFGFGPSTGMVSGTTYYCEFSLPAIIYVPVTFNPTSTASATFQYNLGGTSPNAPGSWSPTTSFPAAGPTGITLVIPIHVLPGQKLALNYSNCTVGQAEYLMV